jgi:hypothetical protein
MLGLSLLLLLFGGIALDFWRGLAVQREMAAVADSAAIAAASGIDEVAYRATGEVLLDRVRSRRLAIESVSRQDAYVETVDVAFNDVSVVTIEVTGRVPIGLLGVFIADDQPLTVRATATAYPQFVP